MSGEQHGTQKARSGTPAAVRDGPPYRATTANRAPCTRKTKSVQLAQPVTRNPQLSMITLKNVEKSYKLKGGFYYVLQQINFTIEQGDFVSIMGPSGAGKSTLLHILGLHDANW